MHTICLSCLYLGWWTKWHHVVLAGCFAKYNTRLQQQRHHWRRCHQQNTVWFSRSSKWISLINTAVNFPVHWIAICLSNMFDCRRNNIVNFDKKNSVALNQSDWFKICRLITRPPISTQSTMWYFDRVGILQSATKECCNCFVVHSPWSALRDCFEHNLLEYLPQFCLCLYRIMQ